MKRTVLILIIFLTTLACSAPKLAKVGEVLNFTGVETNVHSSGYYSRDGGPQDSAYINIVSGDDYSFQMRVTREEMEQYSILLDSCKYIDFDAEKIESSKNTLRFIIQPESIQASKNNQ